MAVQYAIIFLASLAVLPALAADLRPGDYMNNDVIEALRDSRSPDRGLAEQGHVPQSIKVERGTYGLRFIANLNWHEGYTIYTLSPKGVLERGEEDLDYPMPRIDSDSSFQFKESGPEHFWHTYTWVGDADEAVVSMTLVGRYVDRSGHVVEFGSDGVLHGFGPDIRFWLDNDHGKNPFDFFYYGPDRHAASVVAFENRGQALLICSLLPAANGSPSIGKPDCDHPKLVLELLRSPRQPFQKLHR
jgi:hypothetical protein